MSSLHGRFQQWAKILSRAEILLRDITEIDCFLFLYYIQIHEKVSAQVLKAKLKLQSGFKNNLRVRMEYILFHK